jgi:hypothetical protein
MIELELQELKETEDDAWQSHEERIQNSMHDLKETLGLVVSRFK